MIQQCHHILVDANMQGDTIIAHQIPKIAEYIYNIDITWFFFFYLDKLQSISGQMFSNQLYLHLKWLMNQFAWLFPM